MAVKSPDVLLKLPGLCWCEALASKQGFEQRWAWWQCWPHYTARLATQGVGYVVIGLCHIFLEALCLPVKGLAYYTLILPETATV
jgi:hypothetical protein